MRFAIPGARGLVGLGVGEGGVKGWGRGVGGWGWGVESFGVRERTRR